MVRHKSNLVHSLWNRMSDGSRRLVDLVLRRRTDGLERVDGQPLTITARPEVIYDDGWTRIYGPSIESEGWCQIEFLRIPWVEEARARAAAAEQAARQSAACVARKPVATVPAPKVERGRHGVDVWPSQVRAGDGAVVCAADILGQVCRCGRHQGLASHGPVGDDISAFCCPACFSHQ